VGSVARFLGHTPPARNSRSAHPLRGPGGSVARLRAPGPLAEPGRCARPGALPARIPNPVAGLATDTQNPRTHPASDFGDYSLDRRDRPFMIRLSDGVERLASAASPDVPGVPRQLLRTESSHPTASAHRTIPRSFAPWCVP
jgi:hypothetical protein